MAHAITIPRLGWSMEEGIFCEWLKSPGEFVRAGEMIFMLEGEKAAQEIESLDNGYLAVPADAPKPGATVKVGEVVGFLVAEGEAPPASVHVAGADVPARAILTPDKPISTSKSNSVGSATTPLQRVAGPASRRLARQLGLDLAQVNTPDPTGRILSEDVRRAAAGAVGRRSGSAHESRAIATPRARKRAAELGIDWTTLAGTGRGGRIRERDVLGAPSTSQVKQTSTGPSPSTAGRHQPASKLRRVIAERMISGVHQAAPVTLTTKVDASELVTLREQLKRESSGGVVPTYNDMLLELVAQTLCDEPQLNACWFGDGIYQYDEIHIAIAIDTPDGLLAPVMRHVNRQSLAEIARQSKQLVEQTRSGQLKQEQLAGGTFTVTNLGAFGIDAFTPILNLPQAAILGIGRIQSEPVVREGRLEVGQTLTLSLTFDHRVVDGAPAARWLQRLTKKIGGRTDI